MPLSEQDADELLKLANSWLTLADMRIKDAKEGVSNLSIAQADVESRLCRSLAQSLIKKISELRGLSSPKVQPKKKESS
jgi:hypothetical protein